MKEEKNHLLAELQEDDKYIKLNNKRNSKTKY